jgi:predicted MPP superfamily phosphohydrolase
VPRPLAYLLFFAISLGVLGAAHYYVWARLVRDPSLPTAAFRTLTVLMVLLYVSIPFAFWLGARLEPARVRVLALSAFTWMGFLLLFVVLLGAVDLLRLIGLGLRHLASDAPPLDAERRLAISRLLGGGVALVVGGAGLVATRSGLGELVLREVPVRLSRLPQALSGTTIVQLTDLHVGPTIGRELIADVVQRANAIEPDLIVITGDLVDGSVDMLRDHVAPLGELKARWGVYFVTGNHEYYSGVERWCEELTRLGIRVLRNERVAIGDGEHGFDLAGIDDPHGARYGRGHGPDLERALAGRDPKRELVLLAHQPRAVWDAQRHDVGLQLSGHTHGGQIWPWNYLVRLQQPVVSGLARFGRTLVYVSNGTGYWGPPMRLAAPAEITKIVLFAGEEA